MFLPLPLLQDIAPPFIFSTPQYLSAFSAAEYLFPFLTPLSCLSVAKACFRSRTLPTERDFDTFACPLSCILWSLSLRCGLWFEWTLWAVEHNFLGPQSHQMNIFFWPKSHKMNIFVCPKYHKMNIFIWPKTDDISLVGKELWYLLLRTFIFCHQS